MSCALCEERKEKRFCPAVHGKICPQCCGEQREVTLDCPSDCPYLQQARLHEHGHDHGNDQGNDHGSGRSEGSVDRLRQSLFSELDMPEVEISEQFLYEREELILGLCFALAKSARADRSLTDRSLSDRAGVDLPFTDRPLTDRDLIAAVGAVAKSYHTMLNSNIIYQPATANPAQQAIARTIAREIETMVKEFREAERSHIADLPGHTRLRDSDVLKALVFLTRLAMARTSGRPKSRAFIDFLFAQFPEKHSAVVGSDPSTSRIVIP